MTEGNVKTTQAEVQIILKMMKIRLILTIIFLLDGLWETEALTGEVGQQITIKCSHSYADTNVKYFCKGACYERDVLITSRKADSSEKYSIKDEGNIFYVTISDLKVEDSGTYWCGIERVGVDTYVQVVLAVKTTEQNPGDYLKSLGSQKLAYIGAGLGLVLLVLVAIVLVFFRLRKRHVSTLSEKEDDIAFTQKKGPHCVSTTSSLKLDEEMNCRIKQHQDASRNESGIICSKVSFESQILSGDLFYSNVSFSKHTNCSGVKPETDSVTYSSVKHKSKGSCNV